MHKLAKTKTKKPPCNARDAGDMGFTPGLGKMPCHAPWEEGMAIH